MRAHFALLGPGLQVPVVPCCSPLFTVGVVHGWYIGAPGPAHPEARRRVDITGARWSAEGAEAVLKLRAVRANDDFDTYWRYHLDRDRQRICASRHPNGSFPAAA